MKNKGPKMDPWGTPHLMVCSGEQVWLIWTHCWGQEKVRVRWSNSLTFSKEQLGHFPFDQKFLKFRVWEQMEQTFSGISFRNFRCTSQGWPKIPENRNNRKIPFHSTILARAQFLRARKSNSTWLPILLLRPGQGFWVYGIPGYFNSGIWYFLVKIRV